MPTLRTASLAVAAHLLASHALADTAAQSPLDQCLSEQHMLRIARMHTAEGGGRYVSVVGDDGGVPTRFASIEGGDAGDLAAVFARVSRPPSLTVQWSLAPADAAAQLCAPFELSQAEIDAEQRVVVAAGLNYAAHAEEAGGGDVFLFPKPVEPTAPYGLVSAPVGVTLLDYEVELGLVLLGDVDLAALPSEEELLEITAWFVANDITDREPIIRHASVSGPSSGFVEAKGQAGFLPAGPWLVRGGDLHRALAACGADGLGIALDVDEGDGFQPRQDSNTARMLLQPRALLARVAERVQRDGVRTSMPMTRAGATRYYPFAVSLENGSAARIPAGSVILTGTPDGVALDTPDSLGLVWRGLLHARGPFEQFRQEQLARAAAHEPGGFLEPGDRVRARIDGLGVQSFRIAGPGGRHPDPCAR